MHISVPFETVCWANQTQMRRKKHFSNASPFHFLSLILICFVVHLRSLRLSSETRTRYATNKHGPGPRGEKDVEI